MKPLLTASLLILSLYLAHCHICILLPPQRLPLSISEPGDNSCFRRTPYCGGISPQSPTVTYLAGSTANILFQQNLNHWYGANPGYFDIWFNPSSNPASEINSDNGWIFLNSYSDFAANDMVTQTNFTFTFQVPNSETSHGVIVARYVSNNPFEVYPSNNTNAIFYNCIDVSVVAVPEEDFVKKEVHVPSKVATSESCCSPPQWGATAYEINSLGTVIHQIWYDSVNQMVRWDRRGNIESIEEDYLITITNYTVLAQDMVNEYLILPNSEQCTLYGADAFYPWCYGNSSGQTFVQNFEINKVKYKEWSQDNGFRWVTYEDGCLPGSLIHEEEEIVFTSHFVGPIDMSVFDIPSFCSTDLLITHRSCHN